MDSKRSLNILKMVSSRLDGNGGPKGSTTNGVLFTSIANKYRDIVVGRELE